MAESWDDIQGEPSTSPFAGVMAGLAVMLLAAFLAFAGTGAGHGWMRPFMVTMFLFPIWPIGFWLPQRRPVPSGWRDAAAGLLLVVGAGFALWGLFNDDFGEWTYSGHRSVGLPWFGIILLGGAALGGMAWAVRLGRYRLILPVLALGIGLLVDLGLYWQAQFGPGPWGYRGHAADNLWFATWGSWQAMALWALLREWQRYEQAEWLVEEVDEA